MPFFICVVSFAVWLLAVSCCRYAQVFRMTAP
jgi:hypothetical protein